MQDSQTMKSAVESLMEKSESELQAFARSASVADLAEIFAGFDKTIRESNLTSGQAVGENTSKAVSYARTALTLAEFTRDEELQAEAWRMMAYALNANEQFAESVEYYEKAVPALEKLRKHELAVRTQIGWVGALQLVGRVSRDKFQHENNRYWVARLDFYRAEVFFAMRRFWEARSFATTAKKGFENLILPSKVAISSVLLARIALEVGQRSEAVVHARAALNLAEEYKLALLKFPAYAINAQVADRLADKPEALKFYRLAANEIEERRAHLHQDDLRVTFLKGKQQVYEALVRLTLEKNEPDVVSETYSWCEHAKSRGLIDLLSHHLPDVRAKKDDSLLKRINRLHEELNSHYMRSRPETHPSMPLPNSEEIEIREHELAQSLRELSTRDPEYVSLQRTSTASSGCKSGVNDIAGADDLLGLMRGFLYAGARSLLLTLWAVNDRSTSSLMTPLLQQLEFRQEPLRISCRRRSIGSKRIPASLSLGSFCPCWKAIRKFLAIVFFRCLGATFKTL